VRGWRGTAHIYWATLHLDLSALHTGGEQDVSICELIDLLEAFVSPRGVAVGGNGNYPLPCRISPIISYSK